MSLIGTVPKSIDFVNFDLRSPRTAETRSCGKNCWKSWKLIARTISQTPLLFVTQRLSIYSQRYMGKFGETRGGVGKLACWSTKATVSLKRVKIEEKLLWRAYRNSPTLFRTVPSLTPYGLLFPKIWGSHPHPKLQSLLSQERVKLRTSNLVGTFTGSIRTKAR